MACLQHDYDMFMTWLWHDLGVLLLGRAWLFALAAPGVAPRLLLVLVLGLLGWLSALVAPGARAGVDAGVGAGVAAGVSAGVAAGDVAVAVVLRLMLGFLPGCLLALLISFSSFWSPPSH